MRKINGVPHPPWLREQYLIRRRTLPDIAAELGIPAAGLRRHATRLGIPLRPGDGAGPAAAPGRPDLALPRAVRDRPTSLAPRARALLDALDRVFQDVEAAEPDVDGVA